MGANSLARRMVKRVLAPVLDRGGYRYLQATAKAWDIRRGSFTEPELDLVPLAVHEGDTVLDIGANFGMYSYHLSRAVGPSGKVFAFEPVPSTFETLRLIARKLRLRNVVLLSKGCGDRNATLTFRVPLQGSGAPMAGQAHLSLRDDDRGGKDQHVHWARTEEVQCEVVALDDFLPPIAELPFIKCDIEGAELFAFRGAEKTIDLHLPTVLCEIYPWCLEGFGLTLGDLTSFFFSKGYGLFEYRQPERRLREVGTPWNLTEGNFVFLHPSRRGRLSPLLEASPPASKTP